MRSWAGVVALLLVAACGSGADRADQPGEETTSAGEPSQEPSQEPDDGGGGPRQQNVSVDLPGLPIGGGEIVFTEPSTVCASVSWTGSPLPDGVWLTILGLAATPPFTVSPDPCGEQPSCFGSRALTATSGPCGVAVTWAGEPAGEDAALSVSQASAECTTEDLCAQILLEVQGGQPQSIPIVVQAAEDEGG